VKPGFDSLRRPLGRSLALACVFASLFAGAGCGARGHAADPYRALEHPAPAPPARSGAHVWAVGMPLLVAVSANGGATWSSREASTGDPFGQVLFAVTFADASHGWAAGSRGLIVATTDGGTRWKIERRAGGGVGDLLDVAAADARHAWAAGFAGDPPHGVILATTDGGRTWRRQYRGPDVLSSIAASAGGHCWAVGVGGILATTDAGAHWRLQHAMSSVYHLKAVTFVDDRHGWVVGGTGDAVKKPGFVLSTSDGGAHWTTRLAGLHDILNSVSFVDTRRGWVAGNEGLLYRTTDGGATWTKVPVNQSWQLGAVSFGDPRHGWMVVHPRWYLGATTKADDARGWGLLRQLVLLETTDGGETWSAVGSGRGLASPAILTDVTCLDEHPAP